MTALTPRQRRARVAGFIGWIGLIVLQPIWHAWLVPDAHAPLGAVLAIALVPLLLPFLAIRRPTRALLWAGIIALFYFCHGVAEAWAIPPERAVAIVQIVLSLLLIFSLGAGVQRHKKT